MMYPLNAILVGLEGDLRSTVRENLDKNGVVVEREYPNAESAIEGAAGLGPSLFLLRISDSDDIDALRHLSAKLTAQPVMAVVAARAAAPAHPNGQSFTEMANGTSPHTTKACAEPSGDEGPLFRAAMRAGAMQVVSAPIDERDFQAALDCLAVHFGQPQTNMLVAVSGAIGGCGATTLAVNLAYELSQKTERDCLLTELALPLGKLATYLNLKPDLTVRDLLETGHIDLYSLREAVVEYEDRLSVLCGPYRDLSARDHFSDRPEVRLHLLELMDAVKRMAPTVIVEVPATLDAFYFDALAKANRIVLVTEQTLPAIHNLIQVQHALQRDSDIKDFIVVVNKYDPTMKGFTEESLSSYLKVPKLLTVRNDHAAIVGSINRGHPLRLQAKSSAALHDIDKLAAEVTHLKLGTPKRGGMFGWMMGRK